LTWTGGLAGGGVAAGRVAAAGGGAAGGAIVAAAGAAGAVPVAGAGEVPVAAVAGATPAAAGTVAAAGLVTAAGALPGRRSASLLRGADAGVATPAGDAWSGAFRVTGGGAWEHAAGPRQQRQTRQQRQAAVRQPTECR
jgi:hypothetical protein